VPSRIARDDDDDDDDHARANAHIIPRRVPIRTTDRRAIARAESRRRRHRIVVVSTPFDTIDENRSIDGIDDIDRFSSMRRRCVHPL